MDHYENVNQALEVKKPLTFGSTVSSIEQAIVLQQVIDERNYQDTLWGPAFERDNMDESEWIRVIGEYSRGEGRASSYSFEKRMIKVAALAVAAREWQIRNNLNKKGV